MRRNELRTDIERAELGAVVRQLLAIVDAVRDVATSSDEESIKRLRLAELSVRARRLLDELAALPALPHAYRGCVEVLRSPADADPISVGEAIERLKHLSFSNDSATIAQRSPRRRVAPCEIAQPQLPGFDPQPHDEGDQP